MRFGDRIRERREELGMSRSQLAERLGISLSAISNYETGVSFPKEDVMLRLFDCLETEPDVLFQDSFRAGRQVLSHGERVLLEKYRGLSPMGRETVGSVVDALCAYRDDLEQSKPDREPRLIPLYRSPAAAGYAAPVFGEDFDYMTVTEDVPQGAEFAVRIQGGFHVALYPGWLGGLREPGPAGRWGCGHFLCGWRYSLQAVLQGPGRDGVSVFPESGPGRRRCGADRQQWPDSGLFLAGLIFRAPPLPGKN